MQELNNEVESARAELAAAEQCLDLLKDLPGKSQRWVLSYLTCKLVSVPGFSSIEKLDVVPPFSISVYSTPFK